MRGSKRNRLLIFWHKTDIRVDILKQSCNLENWWKPGFQFVVTIAVVACSQPAEFVQNSVCWFGKLTRIVTSHSTISSAHWLVKNTCLIYRVTLLARLNSLSQTTTLLFYPICIVIFFRNIWALNADSQKEKNNFYLFSYFKWHAVMNIVSSYRKNLFQEASLINISIFIYIRINGNKEKTNYLQKCMLDIQKVWPIY